MRSYSLSGSPGDASYRIGVKVEPHGAAGQYIRATVHVGDQVEVGAPRGLFILDDGERPVVLVSAGVGVTPMLAMLHALHDRRSTRDIWWLHGARNRSEHAFAEEAASLLDDLAHVHRRIWYSRPGPTDRAGTDYDAVGRITPEALEAEHVPLDGEYYLCGPSAFMDTLRDGLVGLGVSAGRVHTEIFGAHEPTHARSRRGSDADAASSRRRTGYRTAHHVRALGTQRALGRQPTPASSSWPRPATCRCDGRVAPASATPARPVSSTAPSSTSPSRSMHPPTAICSCAAARPDTDLAIDL